MNFHDGWDNLRRERWSRELLADRPAAPDQEAPGAVAPVQASARPGDRRAAGLDDEESSRGQRPTAASAVRAEVGRGRDRVVVASGDPGWCSANRKAAASAGAMWCLLRLVRRGAQQAPVPDDSTTGAIVSALDGALALPPNSAGPFCGTAPPAQRSHSRWVSGRVPSGAFNEIRGMPQNFIVCDREQVLLLAPSLLDWVPPDHLVWTVLASVEEMDLTAFFEVYRPDGHGRPAYDPQVWWLCCSMPARGGSGRRGRLSVSVGRMWRSW